MRWHWLGRGAKLAREKSRTCFWQQDFSTPSRTVDEANAPPMTRNNFSFYIMLDGARPTLTDRAPGLVWQRHIIAF